LHVEAGAETARAFARDRRDEPRRHAFGGGKDDADGTADRQVDGAGLEGLRALVRADKPGGLEGVGLAVILAPLRLDHDQPHRLFGGATMAETYFDRLRRRADGEHQAERADSGQSGDEELDCSHIMLSTADRLAGRAGLRALI